MMLNEIIDLVQFNTYLMGFIINAHTYIHVHMYECVCGFKCMSLFVERMKNFNAKMKCNEVKLNILLNKHK